MSWFERSRRLIRVALTGLAPALCLGGLHWDNRQVQLSPQPTDKDAVAVFRFSNPGKTPVKILSVETSCSCTVAALDPRIYAPGENGVIKAVFTLGDRVGPQEKIIRVTTDDAPTEPTVLMLRVNIPESFSYSPRLLLWKMTESLTGKSVIITNRGSQKIIAIELKGDPSTQARVKVETIEQGTTYQLIIRPTSFAQTTNTSLSFVARFADNSTHPFMVYALVR